MFEFTGETTSRTLTKRLTETAKAETLFRSGGGLMAKKPTADDPVNAEMGAAFTQVMDDTGITILGLAEKVNVNKDTITEWRKGKLTKITEAFRRTCEQLAVDPDAIMEGRIDRLNAGKLPAAPNRMLERLLASESHDRTLHALVALYRDQFGSDNG